jgi:FtsH-binding integral membrane protein
VVLPIGALLSLIVPAYTFDTVISAFAVTALLAAFMSILAIMYPRFFNSLVSILFLSLLVAFIYQLVAILCGFGTGVWYNWLIVLLFGAYVGLDISFAKNRPKTLDNAVDSACGLYLDLINLFVRLLAILGRGNRQ